MRYPPAFLDEIRARLPVSQVVSRKVALKRRGREYAGLSPFKAEKTPSFFVNDQKGFYHCFASGEHGDIFTFLMKTEGLSFPEAVERLAAEAAATDTPEARAAAEAALKEAKRARRAAKKAARQAKQAQGQGPVQQSNKKAKKEEEEEEETPFDYTKAASVLYANKPPGEEDAPAQNGGKGGKKFDPYTQRQLGGEELRPEKNLNYAKKGRTATFKK